MNWTGGTLQRLKAGRHNGVVHRQKEHFAKVRTQLRNGGLPPVPPFRPSYFQDDDLHLGQLPSDSGTGGLGGHNRRIPKRRNDDEPHITTSAIEYRQGADRHDAAEASLSPRRNCRYVSAWHTSWESPKGKRRATEADTGDQWLEAKRRKLLGQKDWAGLALSRPVNMHFSSRKEKDRLGKRRNITGRLAASHKGSQHPTRHTLHHADDKHPEPCLNGALKTNFEVVRVRFGTDALTTRTSTQHFDPARSQSAAASPAPSSDSMLFEQEHLYPAPVELVQPIRSASPEFSLPIQGHAILPKVPFFEEQGSSQRYTGFQQSEARYTYKEIRVTHSGSSQQSPVEEPTFQITHHIGDVVQPLRFVFDRPSHCSHVGGATHDHGIAEAEIVTTADEYVKCSRVGLEHGSLNMGSTNNASIVDEEGPWKSFLAVPGYSSSRSTTTDGSKFGLSHTTQLQITSESALAEGSQHATIGDETYMSTPSCHSASLPFDKSKRVDEQMMSKDELRCGNRIRKTDEIWQSFILGGDSLASDTEHGGKTAEGEISKRTVTSSKICSPFLAAASCMSKDVRKAANRPLFSKSSLGRMRAISSPSAGEDSVQVRDEYEETAGGLQSVEHSVVGEEQSATHVSVLDKVPIDTKVINVTPSRNGLNRSCGLHPVLAKASEPDPRLHESSFYDSPVSHSDNEGIDLVDPYRLW